MATIATLAALLLPVLNRTKVRAQQANCLSNLRQLGFAWTLYKDDNGGLLAQSYPVNNPYVWVQGRMTNAVEAVDAGLIRAGKLYPYNQNVSIYHCPTDTGVLIGGTTVPAVRSYSMNSFMGGRDASVPLVPSSAIGYVPFFAREGDVPHPSRLFVLLDEDERSINDGFFVTDPMARIWYDFPTVSAHRHNFSGILTFADGHGAIWRFRDPRTLAIVQQQTEQASNPDLEKLAEAATVPTTP